MLALAACGRVGFDPIAQQHAVDAADAMPDAMPDAVGQLIPPGAKIWLRMETDPHTAIVDSAGGHGASCTPTCPVFATGLHGGGYAFVTEEIQVADAADLDSSAGFTAAIWLRLETLPSSLACVWSKPFDGTNVYDTFTLCIQPSGQTVFDCETPAGVADSETGPTIATNQWHHLAMSWDGTTKRGYLDGVRLFAVTVQIGHGTLPVYLGGELDGYFAHGVVDDAVYYTRALTDQEVLQLATP